MPLLHTADTDERRLGGAQPGHPRQLQRQLDVRRRWQQAGRWLRRHSRVLYADINAYPDPNSTLSSTPVINPDTASDSKGNPSPNLILICLLLLLLLGKAARDWVHRQQ